MVSPVAGFTVAMATMSSSVASPPRLTPLGAAPHRAPAPATSGPHGRAASYSRRIRSSHRRWCRCPPHSARGSRWIQLAVGGLVLLNDARGDSTAVANLDTRGFGPCSDVAATLTSRRRASGRAPCPSAGLAGVLDEGSNASAERLSVLLAEVDLVIKDAYAEPNCLIGRSPVKIVF